MEMRQQTGKNQSWRKNWEKKWNKNLKTGWIKRAAAVGLAASMAVTTPLSVLAENTINIEQKGDGDGSIHSRQHGCCRDE